MKPEVAYDAYIRYAYEDTRFEDVIQLYYDKERNKFVDDGGFIVYNIFSIITPNDLFLFKYHKQYMIVHHRDNQEIGVELFYPEEDEYYYER